MIATWMFYCTACALGLALAAMVAERVLLAGRGPVRHVWMASLALSILVPVAAYRYAPRAAAEPAPAAAPDIAIDDSLIVTTTLASPASPKQATANAAAPAATPAAPRVNWRAIVAGTDRPLTIAWIAFSLVLAVQFAAGIILLARTRKAWQRREVLGVPVFVSECTGPALVGAVSPSIVVPEWALALDASQLSLMLRHEQEHQRAHDGRLLFAAQFALILMPWNVALWWQILRLRVAVELDCDARVLKNADPRSYGNLLLEVVRPRQALAPAGVTAFAERATQLERRIRVMARGGRVLRGTRIAAALVALGAVTIAWMAPRPHVPAPRAVQVADTVTRARAVQTPRDTLPTPPRATSAARRDTARRDTARRDTPRIDTIRRATTQQPDTTARALNAVIDSMRSLAGVRDSAAKPDSAIVPPVTIPPINLALGVGRGGRGGLNAQLPTTIYNRLFDGISLTPDQEAKAREIIDNLIRTQAALQDSIQPALAAYVSSLNSMRAVRDSALVRLLSSDTARATLMSRLVPAAGGRRGGGGGAAPPNAQTAPGSGGRGGGGGRGDPAGRGATPGGGRGQPLDPQAAVDLAFTRLFSGISLTPEQETEARAAIAKQLDDQRAAVAPRARQVVAVPMLDSTVVMEVRSDSALMALIANDADRQKLRGRIVNPPPAQQQR